VKYFVTVAGETHELTLDGETVSLDGRSVRAHIDHLEGTPIQLVAIGNEIHRILARREGQRGQYDLSVDGFRFSVEALDERTRTIRELSGSSHKAVGPAHLAAPMPGLIVRVNVTEGDQVRAGQGMVVMEAMKMENELRATAACVVRRILVSPGNAVEKGTILVEMEG